ncbi:S-type pyocin domain-containing protein [Pseudomonas sp. MYb118]|uniref:S-type pyocin domain-containing protein n=1 Tax=Pseudomonas sp. MYb118 TaxID=1848720 RepID=UPI0034CD6E6A
MAGSKDIPKLKNPPSGDGHHVTYRLMNATELAEREARQKVYDAMLARQQAFEERRAVVASEAKAVRNGCVFAKSCKLPDAIIDYTNPSGMVPTDSLKDYGEIAWLGASEVNNAGLAELNRIGGAALAIGRLALWTPAAAAPTGALSVAGSTALVALVAVFWSPSLGDSALYSEEQLRSLKQARTRMRLHVEQQADGTLKGYGFYIGTKRDWEMVDVVQLALRDNQYVADLGDGIELIWTPAVDGSDILGIPKLEAAPQAPHIWVYPPTKQADAIIVDPVYPPDYKDFILVFPVGSGVRPVYVVVASSHKYHQAPTGLIAFPDAIAAKQKTRVKGKGTRKRWKTADGRILEWDYQHGAVEMYDKRGRHLGEFDPLTGNRTKPADSTRRIEP